MERPQNIGIKAIELYFPSQCVAQEELEKFDGVSAGKYTIGLGQTKMAFCDDREDIYSMALTTLSSLIRKYNIDTNQVGRLEVGTETLLDKSKSVKTVLMQLFGDNSNIEGVDTINACYGGTNALFNAVNWVESSGWDGRDAIVVAGDIALYKKGNARPTGGAGCVAMLVGPNAPLVMEPGLRGSHMANVYDFYKADLTSEYPLVDGHYSLTCYTRALDSCYKAYNKREATLKARLNGHANGVHPEPETALDRFDFMSFHVPTCKLVSKCYARLLYNDFLADPENALFKDVPEEVRSLSYEQSLTDKTVEKTFMALAKKRFAARVQPAIQVPTLTGNMYTASVYSSLISLISNVPSAELQGKRVTLFSYGSGLASSMFSIKVNGSLDEIVKKLDVNNRLAARRTLPPQEYEAMCTLREKAHLKNNYQPTGAIDTLAPNTYYLTNVDEMFKRTYEIKQ